ncbi:hypothetical protein PHMEG_00039143 [Phytophthora megakarya]|uniref:Uncharacterized protein n=1 Tax=Phytophthora megakarya TaxID=4795 RepID=A0A225UFM2_9STRA|nr:hypothetical protein PHMEG_00039143 [Phytophthora megakarya]
MSLDLARRLKLKLRTHRQIKVSGLGGVTAYITTHARVKITLGWSVVYVLNIWVGNIGEGVDVLLGMNFMHSAGVRLCIREGLVKLPDGETVVMYDNDPKSRGMDLPVCPEESIHLRPGQDAIVRIRYGQSNPQRELVWAGRGKNWVTKVFSQDSLDLFVLVKRRMKNGNNKSMSVPCHAKQGCVLSDSQGKGASVHPDSEISVAYYALDASTVPSG